jgi:hypothetical protein
MPSSLRLGMTPCVGRYAYRPHSEQEYQPAGSCSWNVVWRPQRAHVRIWNGGK